MVESADPLVVWVVQCLGPRTVQERQMALPAGACVADVVRALGIRLAEASGTAGTSMEISVGIWGRKAELDQPLRNGDRIELYRPLLVDPKVARRERFTRQGARGAGLFSRRRPGGKAGY
ncbi:MAG: RnfH family protein [Burkholderiaceae bacterium]